MTNNDELKNLLNRLKGELDPSVIQEADSAGVNRNAVSPQSRTAPVRMTAPEAAGTPGAEARGLPVSQPPGRGKGTGKVTATSYSALTSAFPAPLSDVGGRARATRPRYAEGSGGETCRNQGSNIIWSENKETLLFGVLAALIAVFGGIISGLDYLTLIGAVVFMLFSFIMALTLFGYYLNSRKNEPDAGELAGRLDSLVRKVETLSTLPLRAPQGSGGGAYSGNRELESKVEELRALVKTLSKALDQNNK